MRKIFCVLIISLLMIFATIFTQKKIVVLSEVGEMKKTVAVVNAYQNLPLTIKFIHSVQKTPVVEELELQGDNFILLRTIYKSHGVGLPFLESDGNFHAEGDFFILDMRREIKNLELRTGKGTNLEIKLGEKIFELYKILPVGTKVQLKLI